jgi:integrase/recombinase XerC
VSSLVRQLAEREGISVAATESPGLKTPADGIPLWVAKLKAERYAERTVQMYLYHARRYLNRDPAPTRLGIQSYLAGRLERVSTAMVNNERKSLSSFFSFVHSEGLWPVNPLSGVRHIKVRYREKLCPSEDDVRKVLRSRCLRKRDTDKLRTLVLLLATTGLRISEAAGLLRRDIDFGSLEVKVIGKGDKPRVVPLLPVTARALSDYIRAHSDGSQYVLPDGSGERPMCADSFDRTLRRACLRAGLTPFTPHQLRHFYATQMLKGGAKVEVVARSTRESGSPATSTATSPQRRSAGSTAGSLRWAASGRIKAFY